MNVRKIFLPDKEFGKKEFELQDGQSLVIVGANGSGKSRLGAWIEMSNPILVHRISAQRSLTVPDFINLKSYQQAFDELFWGNAQNKDHNKGQRWSYGKFTTSLLNDYDKVLSTLFAKQNKVNNEFAKECKEKDTNGEPYNKVPESEIDKIINIWKDIFPHREIVLEDATVFAKYSERGYPGSEMSDGERVALYLMGQCMCAPENSIIIIDEPEVHLHKSIMTRLWNKLEENRKDCIFVYITHDIQFATSHRDSQKLWVHEFLGNNQWNWGFVEDAEGLPEELLLEILGTRKKVLFIEGTRESFDYSLYEQLYPDFYVIPLGSCSKVIESTKSIRNNFQLHHLEAFGLIDRDYRTSYEIEALKKDNIFTLNIAEVENLFCIEEILEIIAEHLILDKSTIETAKKFIIDSFIRDIERQINFAVVSEIKYRLSIYDINKRNREEILQAVNELPMKLNVADIYEKVKELYYNLQKSKDYSEILKYYNQKGVSKSIGQHFNYNNKDFCNLVIRLLNTDKRQRILNGLSKYIPSLTQEVKEVILVK